MAKKKNIHVRKKRSFARQANFKQYRVKFILALEGKETEKQYFLGFKSKASFIQIKIINKGKSSDPRNILRKLQRELKSQVIKKNDKIWVVVDRDQWTETSLNELYDWKMLSEKYGFAVSNPKFEYWLLLHFEDAKGIRTGRECDFKLKRHLPNFDKGHVEVDKILPNIDEAIRRAIIKNTPPCEKWPSRNGSTVYKLVQEIKEVIKREN